MLNKSFIAFAFICSTLLTHAQAEEVGVNVDKVDTSQETTISIKKGSQTTSKKKYQISEGDEEIAGDKDVLMKKAEQNWKKACEDWKKEFKEMNKENKIISISCGKMTCTKEGIESTCQSTGKHKMQVIIEE